MSAVTSPCGSKATVATAEVVINCFTGEFGDGDPPSASCRSLASMSSGSLTVVLFMVCQRTLRLGPNEQVRFHTTEGCRGRTLSEVLGIAIWCSALSQSGGWSCGFPCWQTDRLGGVSRSTR